MFDVLSAKRHCSKEPFCSKPPLRPAKSKDLKAASGSSADWVNRSCLGFLNVKPPNEMNDQPRSSTIAPRFSGSRTGLDVEDIKQSLIDNLFCGMGRVPTVATRNDLYTALALTVRDRVFRHGIHTLESHEEQQARRVAYLSAEYLPGPHLGLNLLNLGITEQTRQALSQLGYDLEDLIEQEEEPGLGNGGLGRLAACFMDSLASLQVPAIGYGIRYEFGIFEQTIRDGWQVERTDKWLRYGNPWEVVRPEIYYEVKFGGHTEQWTDDKGHHRG